MSEILPDRTERLDKIIAEYLQAEEAGGAPPPDEVLAEHSDLANELREFFADRDQVQDLAAALPGTGSTSPGPD